MSQSNPCDPWDEPGPTHSDDWMRLLGWQDALKEEAHTHVKEVMPSAAE